MNLICPYCNSKAILDSSKKVYNGRDFGLMYICEKFPLCDSYVGVHKGTTKPLGRLANHELREWKKRAHSVFDPLWIKKYENRKKSLPAKDGRHGGIHYKKAYARGSGYKWLATQLNISVQECHIGMFDIEKCKKVVEICSRYFKK